MATAMAVTMAFACRQDHRQAASPSLPTFNPQASASPERARQLLPYLPVADSIIRSYAHGAHIPGFAYGIVLDGELIHTNYQGYTNIGESIPVDSLSAFRIASMTKSFTTMAILILRDQGKLALDDPAAKYVKEMANLRYPASDAPSVTIRDLLTHRAGFPEDNPYGDRQMGNSDEQLEQLLSDGPSFSNVPGITYEYSNLGISILGLVIRNITGQRYEDFITANIFKPLGMEHSYWEYTQVPSRQLAHGYRWINNEWREEELLHSGSWGAMGGMITTIKDFSRYMNYHLAAWPPRNGEETGPLKRSSLREMHQLWNVNTLDAGFRFPSGRPCAIVSGYGYGLGIMRDCEGKLYVGHGGGLPGFGSYWRIMPEYGIGIAVFSNRTYAGFYNTSLQVLDTLLVLSNLQPRGATAAPVLEQRKNELMDFLPGWTDAERSPIFAVNFFLDNPVDMLRQRTEEMFKKAGKIRSVSEMVPLNRLRGHFLIEGEKATLKVLFTLSPETEPRIQAFDISQVKQE